MQIPLCQSLRQSYAERGANSRAFSFDGDGEAFRVASEAQRIRLAHLFDPYLAVHSSRIEPLPHQITAVYGGMPPRQTVKRLTARAIINHIARPRPDSYSQCRLREHGHYVKIVSPVDKKSE
jgi:hypothetical protein